MKLTYLLLGILVIIFAFSGVDKLLHYPGFVNALRDYTLIPAGWALFLAPVIVMVELLIAVALLVRPWRSSGALTAVVILGLFTAALAVNQLTGGKGICGCWFTITLAQGTKMHIAQNLLLMAVAACAWWDTRQMRPAPQETPTPVLE